MTFGKGKKAEGTDLPPTPLTGYTAWELHENSKSHPLLGKPLSIDKSKGL